MTTIVSSDLLIADVILPLAKNPDCGLEALMKEHSLERGGKVVIDEKTYHEFLAATERCPYKTTVPGGSSANLLATLGKLLGKAVDIRFIGIADDNKYGEMIEQSMQEAGIKLLPESLPPGAVAHAAESFVIVFPDGQRTIATYRGNARELLQPDMVETALVEKCAALLLQGSLWSKLDPAFVYRMEALGAMYHKELWLTFPTQPVMSRDYIQNFQLKIPLATLLLGNEEEFLRIYGMMTIDDALIHLQETFRRTRLEKQVAFITRGEKGAFIVSRDGIESIAAPPIAPKEIINTLGAGDAAFAGFIAGYLKSKPHAQCAQLGMALAREKLKLEAARLPDPRAVLAKLGGSF